MKPHLRLIFFGAPAEHHSNSSRSAERPTGTSQASSSSNSTHRSAGGHEPAQGCEVPQQHLPPQAPRRQGAACGGGRQAGHIVAVASEAAQCWLCRGEDGWEGRDGWQDSLAAQGW